MSSSIITTSSTPTTSQVWLITGTSSGFGFEMAKHLLAHGDRVIATARKTASIEELGSLGAHVMQLDVTASQEELDKKAKEAWAVYGHIDVLVNNAGYIHFGLMEEVSTPAWSQQFSTNVFGTFNLTRAFLPHFRGKKAGTIVFIGSIGAWDATPTAGMYCASKGALRLSVAALRSELQHTGVKVTLIEPGYFRTSLLNPSNSTFLTTEIPDYSDLLDKTYTLFKSIDGKQPGDPIKGVERIVDVVKSQGLAKGKELPPTLALGSDAVAYIRQKCHEQLKLLDEWEQVSSSTDLEQMVS